MAVVDKLWHDYAVACVTFIRISVQAPVLYSWA